RLTVLTATRATAHLRALVAEDAGQDILEIDAAALEPTPTATHAAHIVEMLVLRFFIAFGVNLASVVAPALHLVGQEVIGGAHLLEAVGHVGLAGIEVRVKLLGQLAVRRLDFLFGGRLGDAQNLVWILHHATIQYRLGIGCEKSEGQAPGPLFISASNTL